MNHPQKYLAQANRYIAVKEDVQPIRFRWPCGGALLLYSLSIGFRFQTFKRRSIPTFDLDQYLDGMLDHYAK
jgi:hypothetical protein